MPFIIDTNDVWNQHGPALQLQPRRGHWAAYWTRPGFISYGRTPDEAVERMKDMAAMWLDAAFVGQQRAHRHLLYGDEV